MKIVKSRVTSSDYSTVLPSTPKYLLLFMGGQMPANAEELHANYNMQNICSLYNQCIAIAGAYAVRAGTKVTLTPYANTWSARGGRHNNRIDTINSVSYKLPDTIALRSLGATQDMAVTDRVASAVVAAYLLPTVPSIRDSIPIPSLIDSPSQALTLVLKWNSQQSFSSLYCGASALLQYSPWSMINALRYTSLSYYVGDVGTVVLNANYVSGAYTTDLSGITSDTLHLKSYYSGGAIASFRSHLIAAPTVEAAIEAPTWCIAIPFSSDNYYAARNSGWTNPGSSEVLNTVPALVFSVSGLDGSGEMKISDYGSLTTILCAQMNSISYSLGNLE